MYGFLLALLVLDGVLLGVVILLQAGKGGGLAARGGATATTDVLGGRQATTLLTRATWFLGSGFMVLSLVLAILSSRTQGPTSVLEGIPAATAPQPLLQDGSPVIDLLPGDDETVPPGEEPPGEDPPGAEDPPGTGDPPGAGDTSGDGYHPGEEGAPPGS